MATKHHPLTSDADTALMLDIDLSILGRCPDRFTEYTEQIRREYSWVPEPLYREKRTEILEGFLRRKRIYQTGEFAGRLEGQARANLLQAVQSLRGSAE
jgi:predicted metal-dependent HD superfamily phosphohydrolase